MIAELRPDRPDVAAFAAPDWGRVEGGPVMLEQGQEFTITTRDVPGNATLCSTTYDGLPGDVRPGDPVAVPIEYGAALLVGEIAGEYLFQGRELLPHRRPARWDRVVPRSAARPPAPPQEPRAPFRVELNPEILGR